jgi:hypothetical protein
MGIVVNDGVDMVEKPLVNFTTGFEGVVFS